MFYFLLLLKFVLTLIVFDIRPALVAIPPTVAGANANSCVTSAKQKIVTITK